MAYNVPPLERLIEKFEKMPSIGKKSAQRIAFYILNLSNEEAADFADAIIDAKNKMKFCSVCQTLTDSDICSVCASSARDKSTICVVEDSKDVMAIERTKEFTGTYHVLHGLISPMDGITPDQLKIKELLARVANDNIKEIILATNPTVEGDATALYIAHLLKPFDIKITRLAYGIPVGGELEYADTDTLTRAIEGRNILN
jgi:recombination protein RecR